MHATIIYPHQLFKEHPALEKGQKVFLVEEPLMMGEFPIHAQKMLLHRLSMQSYKKELESHGFDVDYISRSDVDTTQQVFQKLQQADIKTLHICDTTDTWLEKRIKESVERYGFQLVRYESPLFILEKQDAVERYVESKKHMARFYQKIRKDKDILMQGSEPEGGKWSFDEDNRKKLPKDHVPPQDMTFFGNQETVSAIEWLNSLEDIEIYGERKVWIPYSREGAEEWLQDFLQQRFENFGPYEDALSTHHVRLYHSVLSPLINCGLLDPQYVLDSALAYANKHDVPLNSLEGFVRQIIGWREFIRAAYEHEGSTMRTSNFFNAKKTLSDKWWQGTTGIDPVDTAIAHSLEYGYAHHIERLMVIGNVMLLSDIHPDDVYTWFMALYTDAYDWVMVPNVYGMSQFADGGSFATKPYIAGANYIKKMSDYKKGEWEDTMTGLYWNFIDRHIEVFKNNHRMSMMPRLLEKMDGEKRSNHFKHAQDFLDTI